MIDIEKNKKLQDKLNQHVLEEIFSELPDTFIHFLNSASVNLSMHKEKSGRKNEISARVLNNWISQEVIGVSPDDKGKVKRFDKLESIWLNIVVEARKFGISLDFLKQTRKELFNSPIKNFSLIKFHVLDSILRTPKILLILENGYAKILSYEVYNKWISNKMLPTHISFDLLDFIIPEFENNNFSSNFGIKEPYENIEKLKLLFYLKTGEFKCIKIFVNEFDVRYIENSKNLIENADLTNVISNWGFHKAEVVVNEEVSVMIKS